MGLASELRRRNVFKVGIAYLIVAWLIAQVSGLALESFSAPAWVIKSVLFLLVVGLPLALIFAWAFELTPDGIKLEKDIDRSRTASGTSGRKLDFAIIGLMAIAILYLLLDDILFDSSPAPLVDDEVSEPMLPEGKIMLAVLPLTNLSGDPGQDYFSDGLTEELIAQLSRLPRDRLGVIARTSAMFYKNNNKRVDEIGRELAVDYVLEGSVRRAADRVRITAQLVQIENQTPLWTETFEHDYGDLFALQNEVADRVTRSLKMELLPTERGRQRRVRPANAEAYEAFLKGRQHDYRGDRQELMTAIGHYNDAIEADPEYALAYTALAHAWGTMGWAEHIPFADADRKVADYTQKAAEIDPDLAEVEMLIAENRFAKWDWEAAEAGFRRAFESDPGSDMVAWHYVIYLHSMGRYQEALEAADKGLKLNPHSRWLSEQVAYIFRNTGQYERAIDQYRKTIQLAPQIISYRLNLGDLYAELDRDREAVNAYLGARRLAGDNSERIQSLWDAYVAEGLQGYWQKRLEHLKEDDERLDISPVTYIEIYARLNQRKDALEWVEVLEETATREHVSPRTFADVYLLIGEYEQSIDWLEKAYEQPSRRLSGLKVNYRYDPLRDNPRFQDLLRRMNFPE